MNRINSVEFDQIEETFPSASNERNSIDEELDAMKLESFVESSLEFSHNNDFENSTLGGPDKPRNGSPDSSSSCDSPSSAFSSPPVLELSHKNDLPNYITSQPNIPLQTAQSLEIILSHKPRGSKGIWQPVLAGDRLRVTKGKGKRLKLELTTLVQCEYDKNSLRLQLVDVEPSNSGNTDSIEGYSIESMKAFENSMEMELKLYRVSKKMYFQLDIRTKNGIRLEGRSVEISTHNSGTVPSSNSISTQKIKEESLDTFNPSLAEFLNENKRKREEVLPIDDIQSFSGTSIPGPVTIQGHLEVTGIIQAKGFLQISDSRLKTEVRDIVDALDTVTRLQGKTYRWKSDVADDKDGGERVIGFIAQEVRKILPEVVHEEPETGFLAVSYSEILPVLIEAFKEFLQSYKQDKEEVQTQLSELKEKIESVSERISEGNGSKNKELELRLNRLLGSYQDLMIQSSKEKSQTDYSPQYRNTIIAVCKASQMAFAVLFAISLIMVISGIALTIEFKPSDSQFPQKPSSNLADNPQQKYNLPEFQKEKPFTTDGSNEVPPSDPPPLEEGSVLRYIWFVLGIILLSVGMMGMLASGVGLFCCSTYMCSRTIDRIPIL